jgi:hypothetical protein
VIIDALQLKGTNIHLFLKQSKNSDNYSIFAAQNSLAQAANRRLYEIEINTAILTPNAQADEVST